MYLILSVTSCDIYVPFDVTPKSGTKPYISGDISFDRESDFLIKIENDVLESKLEELKLK